MFHPFHPRVEEVCIEDIAHGLARHCRFNGQCRDFYSVAQHSAEMAIYAYEHGEKEIARWCLFHDAAEAYLPDVTRPIKGGLGWVIVGDGEKLGNSNFSVLPFESVESRILHIVAAKFELPLPIPPAVWAIDDRMLATEKRDLLPNSPDWPGFTAMPFPKPIHPAAPYAAEGFFLNTFKMLFENAGVI
jgi:hypothetical protein